MDKREIKLPKEWEKLKGKKIVLRNFHYTEAGGAYDEASGKGNKMIYEMRKVLNKYEGTNIGYIYRCHPMTETMFKIYVPKYLEEWEKVKKEIERSSNVVIDYNESYECAFKFSDIFFTNFTSMITQYALTKKPIVIYYWGEDTFEKTVKLEETEDYLLKYTELYSSKNNTTEAEEIRDRVFAGDDYEQEKRMNFIDKYIGIKDGKIGERLADRLIEEMLKEDGIK